MKIKWLGHSSFLITSQNGTRIITDPYTVGAGISYGQIEESADVVLVSHGHGDHSNAAAVKGNPQVLREPGAHTAKGIEFRRIPCFHDEANGSKRGSNVISCFALDGLKVCHLGDLGHPLSIEQVKQIIPVDVLFIPVGGYYTVDAAAARQVCDQLNPRVVFPMHYKTEKCGYPIAGVDEFLKGREGVNRAGKSEVELTAGKLKPGTVVLQHAL